MFYLAASVFPGLKLNENKCKIKKKKNTKIGFRYKVII